MAKRKKVATVDQKKLAENKFLDNRVRREEIEILILYKFYKLQMQVNQAKYDLLMESQRYVSALVNKKKMERIKLEMLELQKYNNNILKKFAKLTNVIYKFAYTGTTNATFRIVLVEYLMKDRPADIIMKEFNINADLFYVTANKIKKMLRDIRIKKSYLV